MAKESTDSENIQDLKKLSPKDRLKRLKELEEKRKKEMEETESLLSETIKEVDKEDLEEDVLTFQTLRQKLKPLNEIGEKELSLEDEVREAQGQRKEEEQSVVEYNISKEVTQIYQGIQGLGYTTGWGDTEKKKFDRFQDRLSQIAENYALSKDVEHQVAVSQNLADTVKQYTSTGNQDSGDTGMQQYSSSKKKKHDYI